MTADRGPSMVDNGRPKSVWILNHYAGFPETVPATRTYELSRRLFLRGWNVTVIACTFNHYTFTDDYPGEGEPIKEVNRDGVRWVLIKGAPYGGNGLSRLRNMLGYARRAWWWARAQPGPDVIIGTSVHPFAPAVAGRLAGRFGSRFCYEITDLWPESLVDLGMTTRGSVMYRVMNRLEHKAFATADGVIGLFPGIPEYANERHGLTLHNFCYVPNGMAVVDAGVRLPPTVGAVAYAGGFARAHGMSTIVKAGERLARDYPGRFTFHLYGDGPERAEIEAALQERRIEGFVLHGLVPKRELRERLSAAEVLLCTGEVLPVHRFGMSFNKLFDYFDAERPVIFAVDSGNDPVREAGAGLSVPAGDEGALAAAIVELSDRGADARAEMGRRGREFLLREHTFDVLTERLDEFLHSVIAGPVNGGRQ